MFNQFFHSPRTAFDSGSLRWRHADGFVRFAKIVINEIQVNRSLKIFKLLAESVRQARQPAVVP